jgi:hypothetical protein
VAFVILNKVAVRVPLHADRTAAGVEVHESHATLHQSPGQKAAGAEISRVLLVGLRRSPGGGASAVVFNTAGNEWTVTPEEAMRFAARIIEMATGAQSDAFLCADLMEQGFDLPASKVLTDFREWRTAGQDAARAPAGMMDHLMSALAVASALVAAYGLARIYLGRRARRKRGG